MDLESGEKVYFTRAAVSVIDSTSLLVCFSFVFSYPIMTPSSMQEYFWLPFMGAHQGEGAKCFLPSCCLGRN